MAGAGANASKGLSMVNRSGAGLALRNGCKVKYNALAQSMMLVTLHLMRSLLYDPAHTIAYSDTQYVAICTEGESNQYTRRMSPKMPVLPEPIQRLFCTLHALNPLHTITQPIRTPGLLCFSLISKMRHPPLWAKRLQGTAGGGICPSERG